MRYRAAQELNSFNSTMVRLKDSSGFLIIELAYTFQFHYGSIKGAIPLAYIYDINKFQFHYGSIKGR